MESRYLPSTQEWPLPRGPMSGWRAIGTGSMVLLAVEGLLYVSLGLAHKSSGCANQFPRSQTSTDLNFLVLRHCGDFMSPSSPYITRTSDTTTSHKHKCLETRSRRQPQNTLTISRYSITLWRPTSRPSIDSPVFWTRTLWVSTR